MKIFKIISGGQTGADRGGLIAAELARLSRGGFCPAHRLSEDGVIPDRFPLTETARAGYLERTKLNIMSADLTVVFIMNNLTPGSRTTIKLAIENERPHTTIDCGRKSLTDCANDLVFCLNQIERDKLTINVAGSRESLAPGLTKRVAMIILLAIEKLHGVCASKSLQDLETPLLNRHHLQGDLPVDGVYIGRGSPWGNPFAIEEGRTRREAISLFHHYLEEHEELIPKAKEALIGRSLICSCAPKPCHGDIWKWAIYKDEHGVRMPGTWPRF